MRSGHYSLGAFGPLNLIEALELASNYYIERLLGKETKAKIVNIQYLDLTKAVKGLI